MTHYNAKNPAEAGNSASSGTANRLDKPSTQTPRKPSEESFQGFPDDDYEEEVAEIPFAVLLILR